MGDKEHNQLKNEFTNAAEGDDARAEILNMIESGQIDVEEGLKRLQDSESEESNSGVLNQLEAGEIDVNEAIRFIESESVHEKDSAAEPEFGRDSRAGCGPARTSSRRNRGRRARRLPGPCRTHSSGPAASYPSSRTPRGTAPARSRSRSPAR